MVILDSILITNKEYSRPV